MIRKKAVYLYLILTFALAWSVFGATAYLRKASGSPVAMLFAVASAMFAPAIATIIVKRSYLRENMRDLGFGFRKMEYHIIAWVLPVILALFSLFLTLSLGFGKLDPTMQSFLGSLSKEAVKSLGSEIPPFWSIVLISMFLPVILNCFFTVGEEVGWRGFLQSELRPLGQKRSYLLIGLIWGIWHVPMILQGLNYPDNPYLGIIWMIVFCVLLSYILGWLKDSSGSVMAPTIAHASLNGPAMTVYAVLKDSNSFLGGPLGIAGFISMGLFVCYLLMTKQID